ncbi:MAG: hypothetical protein ABIS20_18840 [Thermoanaerobaculia bacterium]
MSLRLALVELSRRFGDVVAPARIHAPFLMALLRVSDALQIHASRAPVLRLRMQALRSPLSVIEWAKHAAVTYTSVTRADPEEIYVFSRPESVSTYVGVRRLLAELQGELDSSWAVIGEVYGRQAESGLDKLGLSIRRVRSNLDDPDLISALPFLPRPATLSAASGEVLVLLSGPLYGDDPTFAVRELIQNAVDAVSTRLARSDSQFLQDQPLLAPVVVELFQDRGEKCLRVTDVGIGMTADVICDYLLRGGATLSWLPPEGKLGLPHIGRFGIGALSYFLLADHFEVRTRHADAPPGRGIALLPSRRAQFIEMRHCDTDIGTTILFRLSDHVYDQLKAKPNEWDWWCLQSPIVSRLIEGTELPQAHKTPRPEEKVCDSWFHVEENGGYRALFWSYQESDTLIVNGILVKAPFGGAWILGTEIPSYRSDQSLDLMGRLWPIELRIPSISVFDGESQVGLNLARTDVARDSLPLDLIRADVLKVIARTFKNHAPKSSNLHMEDVFRSPHPALYSPRRHNYGLLAPWIVAGAGSAVFDIEALPVLGMDRLIVIAGSLSEMDAVSSHIQMLLKTTDRAAAVFLDLDSAHWFARWVDQLRSVVDAGPTRIAAARCITRREFKRLNPEHDLALRRDRQDGEQTGESNRFLDLDAVEPLFVLANKGRSHILVAELLIEPSGQVVRRSSDPAWLAMTDELVDRA